MAAGSGSIGIRLLLNGTGDVVRGLRRVSDASDRSRRSFEAIGKMVPFGGIMRGVGVATAALGGLAAAAVGVGVKTAASMEQAQISFTTMLGSAQEADAFIRQLQDFAAKTPFDFPGLQSAASSLISAGIDANKVIPIMTSLGNATSGMGTGAEGIQRATVALQQMNAAQKISGEDLNQLRDAGIPVYDLLAASMGKSKEEVAGLAQSGKLGKDALDALMKGLESGQGLERFSGLMDKQSQSLSGLAATFQDTIQMGLAQTMTPLVPVFKTLLQAASDLAARVMPQIQAGLAAAAPAIERVAGGVAKLMSGGDFSAGGIAAAFSLTPEQSQSLSNFMTTFKAGAEGVQAALAPVWEGIKNAPVSTLQVLQGVLAWMADHTSLVSAMASALATVVTVMTAIRIGVIAWTAVQTVLNLVLAANPIGLIIVAIGALVGGLIVAYQKSETFRGIVDFLWTSLKQVWGVIVDVAKVVWDLFLKFTPLGQVITTVKNNWDTINGVIQKFVGYLKDAWDMAKKVIDVVSGIGASGGGIGDVLNMAGQALGFRAEGGPVQAGQPYIVGERGPELMVPRASGTVISNEALSSRVTGSLAPAASQMGGDYHFYLDGAPIYADVQRRAAKQRARA